MCVLTIFTEHMLRFKELQVSSMKEAESVEEFEKRILKIIPTLPYEKEVKKNENDKPKIPSLPDENTKENETVKDDTYVNGKY